MYDYEYSLTEKDYLSFCKNQTYGEKKVRIVRWGLFLAVPGLAVLLGLYFRFTLSTWLFILAISIGWLFLSGKIFSGLLDLFIRKRIKNQESDVQFETIRLKVDDSSTKLNGKKWKIKGMQFFPNMLVLYGANDQSVLLPSRIFSDQEEMKNFVLAIHKVCAQPMTKQA